MGGVGLGGATVRNKRKRRVSLMIVSVFSAKDDGVDIDALAAEIEGAGASKEQKGKKKKKGAKRDDFE